MQDSHRSLPEWKMKYLNYLFFLTSQNKISSNFSSCMKIN